jgi:triosephosphate isomerase (TIM)
MRKKIVAGNWKMNKLIGDAVVLADAIKAKLADKTTVEVVLCPTFTALKSVGDVVAGTQVKLGGQTMHWEKDGAFTGEISADMLKDAGCQYVILGHSERRQFFGETDGGVNRKVKVALAANLTPIVCVGETLEQREANQTEDVVTTQVTKSLAGLDETGFRRIVVAYEPVWAIGTGRTASPAQAQDVHALIRRVLSKMCNPGAAQAVRIQYGGSMKPANAKELMSQPDIDGGLIGGAALDAASFIAIVEAAG